MGVMRPDMIMKSIIPVVMAGVLGIYGTCLSFAASQTPCASVKPSKPRPPGCSDSNELQFACTSAPRSPGLITAVIINGKMDAANYSAYSGYAHLGAGSIICVGSVLCLWLFKLVQS